VTRLFGANAYIRTSCPFSAYTTWIAGPALFGHGGRYQGDLWTPPATAFRHYLKMAGPKIPINDQLWAEVVP
jgi:hypothetical protein